MMASVREVNGVEERRIVPTELGEITYTVTRKKVKNLNLRIRESGEIAVSIPQRCNVLLADDMISRRAAWIREHLERIEQLRHTILLPEVSREACRTMLQQSLERVYPLIRSYGVEMPELKLRRMRSQWGNCHWNDGYITLNTALVRCPEHLRDYVALHELIHFLYHDHGRQFHALQTALMPDWKQRRKQLKTYGGALNDSK